MRYCASVQSFCIVPQGRGWPPDGLSDRPTAPAPHFWATAHAAHGCGLGDCGSIRRAFYSACRVFRSIRRAFFSTCRVPLPDLPTILLDLPSFPLDPPSSLLDLPSVLLGPPSSLTRPTELSSRRAELFARSLPVFSRPASIGTRPARCVSLRLRRRSAHVGPAGRRAVQ